MKVFAKEDSLFIQFESVKPESKIQMPSCTSCWSIPRSPFTRALSDK